MTRHLLLALATLVAGATSCAREPISDFEAAHLLAVAKNPSGVSMALDTIDGKRTYSEGEFIPLVIRYSSQTIIKYKVETGLGMNAAAESQRVVTDQPKLTVVAYLGGFACCGSRLEPLNLEPVVFKPFIKIRLHPGKRGLYITAGQVFPWLIKSETQERGKEITTTSNILWLDITPDPDWQRRELAKIIDKCGLNPCAELNLLSTPGATAQKLKAIEHCDCRGVSFQRSEYESARAAMEQWLHASDHTMPATAIDELAQIRATLDDPEFDKWPDDAEKSAEFSRKWLSAIENAKAGLVEEVCAGLPAKNPAVQISTKKSACEVLRWEPKVESTTCGCPVRN